MGNLESSTNHDTVIRHGEMLQNLTQRTQQQDMEIDGLEDGLHRLELEVSRMAVKVGLIVAGILAVVNGVFGLWLVHTFGG